MAAKLKNPEALQKLLTEMLQFIIKRPSGYSQDDMIWLMKTWAHVGVQIKGPRYVQDFRQRFLCDYNVPATATMPRRDINNPDEDKVKPSQVLRQDIGWMLNQIYGGGENGVDSCFNHTEGSVGQMIYAYRIKLAQSDAVAASHFRREIVKLAHQRSL